MVFQEVTRFVLQELARRDRWDLDVHPVGTFLERVDRHLLLVVSSRPFPGDDAVLPAMPRARDEFAIQSALGERATLVIADVGDCGQPSLMQKEGDAVAIDLD